MVFMDGMHGNRRHAVAIVYALNSAATELKQAIVGSDPYLSFTVLVNRPHKVVEQAILSRERAEDAVFVADQPAAFGGNPKGVISRDDQTENIVFGKSWGIVTVE